MNEARDRLDRAFEALRRDEFPGDRLSPEKEASLLLRMRAGGRRRSRRGAWLVAASLVLCGGGFAAGGGIEKVRQWLISVKILRPDGSVTEGDIRDVRENEDGSRTLRLGVGRDTEAEIRVTPPAQDPEGKKRLDVRIEGDDSAKGSVIVVEERKSPEKEGGK